MLEALVTSISTKCCIDLDNVRPNSVQALVELALDCQLACHGLL